MTALRVGVISDTHGLLRDEALSALAGVDRILHLGDVGDPSILTRLAALAPVTAVRGNIDKHGPCSRLPATEFISLCGHNLYLVHDRATLDLEPTAASIAAVLYGHSHQSLVERRGSVLFFNPGSAGPRRFSLPISLGILDISADGLIPHLVSLL